jgi:FkbM family methyltransferase
LKPTLYNFLKKRFKRIIHALGYDVHSHNIFTSEDVLLKTILEHFNIRTVLDVGANEGQFGSKIIDLGYSGKIYSFEPIVSVHKMLTQNASKFPQWSAINMGIGNKEEELMINVSENLASSSVFEVDRKSVQADPATRTTHQEKIKITTIDSFVSSQKNLDAEILLKLDIQGFELEALKGARASLPNFKLIQVELSFIPVYEKAPLYKEVINFLEENDFEIFTLTPAFVDGKTGRMLQADGIFVRKN